MSWTNSHVEHLYQGFLKTPLLWNSDTVGELKQLSIPYETSLFKRLIHKPLRLGQLAEQFVFNQLEHTKDCKILAENVQIKKDKQTLGELDALLEYNSEWIHLEIVYKFYLYDATLGSTEIERWIGPNRNDSLVEKVNKLKTRQLPLLYASHSKSTLAKHHLNVKFITQYVLFKAQLFVPYQETVPFNHLNNNCVCGFYIHTTQLEDFSMCQFYIPSKLDWFLEPNLDVNWLNFEQFRTRVETFLNQFKSPLIWIKKPDDIVLKCFLVWW